MKKLLLITLAAFAMTNCAKESVIDSDLNKNGNTIGFSSYNVTRGNPINDNAGFLTAGNSFGVTAFINITGNDAPYMGAANVGAQITSNGTVWNYEKKEDTRYWPTGGETLDFYAYAPFTDANRLAPAFTKAGGMIFTDYIVPTTASEQNDFMYTSQLGVAKPTGGANSITLTFHHAMTQILFKVKAEATNLHIEIAENGITLNNINSKGTFTLSGANAVWSGQSELVKYTVPSALAIVDGTTPVDVFTTGNVLMLLPQSFIAWDGIEATTATTGGYLSINCKIYYEVDGVRQYLKGDAVNYVIINVPFSSKNGADEIWLMKNKITYTLLIDGSLAGLDPIEFTTDVEDWTAGNEIEL